MEDFTYEELRLILIALETEIIRRENNSSIHSERIVQFENLAQKVFNLIQDIKNNN